MSATGEQGENRWAPIYATYTGPGPARYAPKTTMGLDNDPRYKKAPGFSMGGAAYKAPDSSPGPVYAVDARTSARGRDTLPSISLGARFDNPAMKRYVNPVGPGAYNTDTKPPNHRRAPTFVMGGRTEQRRVDDPPAPNTYQHASTLGPHPYLRTKGSGPAFRSRHEVGSHSHDLAKTPGPAGYQVANANSYKRSQPTWSLAGRTQLPVNKNQNPGPGAHDLDKWATGEKASPRWSMGVRHSQYIMPKITAADVIDY